MNRDEWNAILDNEPLTPNQQGAIMREFERLRFHPRYDRAERLAICAALLDLDELDSTADLTMGQAGYLVNLLRRTGARNELRDMATARGADDGEAQLGEHADDADADGGQDHDGGEFISVAEAINRILLVIAVAVYGMDLEMESGNVALHVERLRARGIFSAQGRANSAAEWAAPLARAHGEGLSSGD